jgi:hypothetical protein
MSVSVPYSEENIFDLTIRLYGTMAGLSGVVGGVTSLDSDVSVAVTYEPMTFVDYVQPEQPVTKKADLVYIVGEGQSIYDLALQLTGNLSGMADIIGNYSRIDENTQGATFTVPRKNDILVDIFLANQYIFATKDVDLFQIPILDRFPSMLGYSLRKVNSSYVGACIKVRRSSDDTTKDIGFVDNAIDKNSLTTFVGGNDGFIDTLYDQMGNNDMTQLTNWRQPKIVDNGSVVTSNSLPAMLFDGVDDYLFSGSMVAGMLDADSFASIVFESLSSEAVEGVLGEQILAANRISILSDTRNTNFRHSVYDADGTGAVQLSFGSEQSAGQRLFSYSYSIGTIEGFAEGSSVGSDTVSTVFPSATVLEIGRQASGGLYLNGYVQEVLTWATDELSNRSAIEGDLNNYYNVY